MCKDRIQTKDRLFQWGVTPDATCVLCFYVAGVMRIGITCFFNVNSRGMFGIPFRGDAISAINVVRGLKR